MEKKSFDFKSIITAPNIITMFRLIGAVALAFPYFELLSPQFFILYTFCGVTDVLDGFIARLTKTTTDFGSKLDSVADLLFYGVVIIKLLGDMLASTVYMPFMIISLLVLRIGSYSIAAIKHKKFASLHTYMNKLTGLAAFTMPYMINWFEHSVVYAVVYVIAVIAAVEETFIHLKTPVYEKSNRHAIKVVKDNKKQAEKN